MCIVLFLAAKLTVSKPNWLVNLVALNSNGVVRPNGILCKEYFRKIRFTTAVEQNYLSDT